jgi:hypothetical protein
MKNDHRTSNTLSRRRLLARVGLIAGAAYVTPTMIGLNAAHASGASNSGPSNSGPSNSGPSRDNSGPSNSGPSRDSSGPSRSNSGPSRRNSGPSRRRGANNDLPPWLRRLLGRE